MSVDIIVWFSFLFGYCFLGFCICINIYEMKQMKDKIRKLEYKIALK